MFNHFLFLDQSQWILTQITTVPSLQEGTVTLWHKS